MKLNSINRKQGLYIIRSGPGYSCLGFDVLDRKAKALAAELGEEFNRRKGTKAAFEEYNNLLEIAREKHEQTGWRSTSELTPQLVGLEGKRVEIETEWGERERFWVGKSTGFVPCHLAIKQRNSSGGCAVVGVKQVVRVIKSS